MAAEGLDADVQKFLENLDTKFDNLTATVANIDKKSELHGLTLSTQDKHLERIEIHLSQINGGCKQHATELATHDKRVSLLEAQILMTAASVEARRLIIAENLATEKRKPIDIREDWWKFLMVIAALAAGFGSQVIGKMA